jgi:hypothetical protein
MRTLAYAFASLGLVLGAGCPGTTVDSGAPDAAGVDDAAPDAAVPDPTVKLSGKTLDYFAPAQAMDNVTVTSDGLDPTVTVTSAVGGAYEVDGLPTGSTFYVSAVRPLYRPTRSTVTIAADPVMQDIYLMTLADVSRQYATTGNTLAAGKAFVAAELRRANGTPMIEVPLADITLVDAQGVAVPDVKGPYVFGSLGDVDPALVATAAFNGSSRVAFLDVPPGSYTLKVDYTDNGGGAKSVSSTVVTVADGATIVLSQPAGGAGGGGGGGGDVNDPALITNPTFETDIYPLLQRASAGGLGCGNCHTAGGAAAILPYDGGAAATLTLIQNTPGVLDLATPANSLLLTMPLYEPAPANHPNATFIDINDPYYQLFLRWITQGALP